MGTINYGHNNYINIGMNLNQFDDILNYDDRQFEYETELDYLWVDYYEKALILKELTQLKQFLLQCCENGLVKYSPGWCMGYYDEQTTIKAIKSSIRETKENIKKYPTYRTYRKGA